MFLFVSGCQWTRTGACPSWKGRFYSLNIGLDAVSGLVFKVGFKNLSDLTVKYVWTLFEKEVFPLQAENRIECSVYLLTHNWGCWSAMQCKVVMWLIVANWFNVIYWSRVCGFLLAFCIKHKINCSSFSSSNQLLTVFVEYCISKYVTSRKLNGMWMPFHVDLKNL